MPKNASDFPFGNETRGAAAESRADVALCRFQEIAEAENRFRARQNLQQGGFEPSPQTNGPSHGIEPSSERAIEKEIKRYHGKDDGGSSVTIIQYQYFLEVRRYSRTRQYPGSRRLALENGEAVRQIDDHTFEAIRNGELIRTQTGQV